MAAVDGIDFTIINDQQLLKLFNELNINEQNKIAMSGIRAGAKVINDQAKVYFEQRKKNRSKTNYQDLNSVFKIEKMRANKDSLGVKAGVKYAVNYKYRWLEWGTEDRVTTGYKKKRFTGKVEAIHFFYDAVEARKPQVQETISTAVNKSLERTIKRYSK